MTNEEALESALRKILVAGEPLLCHGNPLGLAFVKMFVKLTPEEHLAVSRVIDKIQEKEPSSMSVYKGKAQTHPSTLYMDGTSPVTVFIQATTDELRAMHNSVVELHAVTSPGCAFMVPVSDLDPSLMPCPNPATKVSQGGAQIYLCAEHHL